MGTAPRRAQQGVQREIQQGAQRWVQQGVKQEAEIPELPAPRQELAPERGNQRPQCRFGAPRRYD